MSKNARPPLLRDALEPWCAAGVNGAVRMIDAPGGVVYIVDGRIAYAECPAASSVERLLNSSGRLPAEAWRTAVNAGRAQCRIGEELANAGLVTPAEMEATGIIALHDAAFFLFDVAATARFEPGVRHPLGSLRTLDLRVVCQEVDRRKRLLADAWPEAAIDTAAVLPQRRLRTQCVALTALQWEVVANADRRRTPIDIARLLGRDTFTVMLEVRRMARAGLVEPGRPGGSAAAESVATVRARAATRTVSAKPKAQASDSTAAERASASMPEIGLPAAPLPQRAARQVAEGTAVDSAETRLPDQILARLIAGLGAL